MKTKTELLADIDRVTAERDAALGRELQSRNDLAKSLADHFRKNSEISALGEASKKLVFCARTSGGTAGPDQGLMDACAGVEGVITLGGIARAMNEFERLTAECDDLASRLEEALVESLANQNEREVVCVNYEALQQRLTAADERAVVLETEVARLNRVKLALKELVESHAGNLSVYRCHLSEALAMAEKVRDASLGMQRKCLHDLIDYLHQSGAALKTAEGGGDA